VIVRDAAAHRDAFALVPEYLQREDEGGGSARAACGSAITDCS
jgi:hypothetical protein